MLRAVIDTNVLVSALLSPRDAPAAIVQAWMDGAFELVVSTRLLDELAHVLTYPKLRQHVTATQADRFLVLLRSSALDHEDPTSSTPVASRDPDDNFLIRLAATASAYLVSGDADLLELASRIPVLAPGDFLDILAARS